MQAAPGGLSRRELLGTALLATAGVVLALPGDPQPREEPRALDVRDFGAVGDGVTDDRAAIQAAVDAAGSRFAQTGARQTLDLRGGVFSVGVVDYTRADATRHGICSLVLRDGVDLRGGVVKVRDQAYGEGAFYRCITSGDAPGLSRASVRDLTVDGNRENQVASDQCSNVLLECADDVTVENVSSVNANGDAIMLRGSLASAATNLRIVGCSVRSASRIGIQASQFDGLVISGNHVDQTADNGIDVYGEDGTTLPNGRHFSIVGNTVRRGLVGIFLETVRDGVATGNAIATCTAGVRVNRINGEPRNITISANVVRDCDHGVSLLGDTGGVLITGNTLDGFTVSGVELGGGGGNASRAVITGNLFSPAAEGTYLIRLAGEQSSFNRATANSASAVTPGFEVQHGAVREVDNRFDPFDVVTAAPRR